MYLKPEGCYLEKADPMFSKVPEKYNETYGKPSCLQKTEKKLKEKKKRRAPSFKTEKD